MKAAQNLGKGIPGSFFEFKLKNICGETIDFAKFQGKKAILVVNVASK